MKSNTGGSGGRRSSAGIGGINSQSLGSTSATSGSSSGGKRSVHSGGSIDSANRDRDGLTRQMNILLRTKSESGKRLSDTVRLFTEILNFFLKLNIFSFLNRAFHHLGG